MRIRGLNPLAPTLLLAIALAIPASAQDAQPVSPRSDEAGERTPDAPLSGPKVEDATPPGGGIKMAERAEGAPVDPFARPYPHQVFMEVVMGLARPGIGADDRLTPEQQKKIRELNAAHRAEVREFRRKHRKQFMEALRAQSDEESTEESTDSPPASAPADEQPTVQEGKGNPERAAPDAAPRQGSRARPVDPSEAKSNQRERSSEARRLFEKLRKLAPDPAPTQRAIWKTLTKRQRTLADRQLASWREARIEERQRQRAEERIREAEEKEIVPAPLERSGTLDRFREMSPEQRREALERLRKRRERLKEEKPAPEMEEVDVPPPDEAGE